MYNNFNNDADLIDTMLDCIEDQFDQDIAKVAKLEGNGEKFNVLIVFRDYHVLDAEITIYDYVDIGSMKIEGYYY